MTFMDRQRLWMAFLVFAFICWMARPTTATTWLFAVALGLRFVDTTQRDLRRWRARRRRVRQAPYTRGWTP